MRASRALVVGAGGLGCPAALYLAAGGLGGLTIADGDKVDLTNLQRQILYRASDVGVPKVDAAGATLAALNPEVELILIEERLDEKKLDPLVQSSDIVLDCSDNFATRHALNRACVARAKPLVSGAAMRFDAQLMVFDLRKRDAPCYACLFPENAEVEDVQCSVMGVFAPLTGAIGAMQAMEAIKLLAGVGQPRSARLMLVDAKDGDWRTVRIDKDPGCAVCARRSIQAR